MQLTCKAAALRAVAGRGGEAVLYAYGPHAGDLFTAMEPALRDSTIRPAYAIVRYGTPPTPTAAKTSSTSRQNAPGGGLRPRDGRRQSG
ncbi:hypothetical protein GCM10023191_079960 [Actinoallomurus oryzae]|uniref:Uncharacterized protein n=1 Tax=Actinoallomurus oryzae TaxID=502180 RepID=A0ABP8QYD3_9ACTN